MIVGEIIQEKRITALCILLLNMAAEWMQVLFGKRVKGLVVLMDTIEMNN